MGKPIARSWVRNATAAVVAIAATAATFAVVETSASAENNNAGCSAVAVNAAGPTPVTLAYANQQYDPCDTDTQTVLAATATIIPAPLGIGATKAKVSAATSKTSEGYNYFANAYEVKASSDIAKLTLTGPGLNVVASGIHSDVTIKNYPDGPTVTTTNSWVATLTVNGIPIKVQKNTPITIPIGLRIALYLNFRTSTDSMGQAVALGVTFPDYRYYLTLAQSQAELGCHC